jgi:translation initiation factor eIF-2B subunit epsilon
MSSSCVSEGDALRELDAMNIVRSDPFILIQGGVVANINLKSAITFHKQKRADDPNNIMTVVLRKLKRPACSLVSLQDDLIVSMDRQTKQILLFENSLNDAHLRVSLDLMAQQEEMSFHTDLLDCRIDICSPEFLLQFSDNFDYQVYWTCRATSDHDLL